MSSMFVLASIWINNHINGPTSVALAQLQGDKTDWLKVLGSIPVASKTKWCNCSYLFEKIYH